MRQYIYFLSVIVIPFISFSFSSKEESTSKVFNCSECDFVIDTDTGVVDGEDLSIEPGDIIGLSGSGDSYHNITFRNIIGTEEKPILIKNCNGKAIIESNYSFGIKFRNSKNFKLEGDGDSSNDYGIKISTTNGFFLTFEYFSTDFEVHHVEVAGYETNGIGEDNGFAGIGLKTSPYQDCDTFTDATRTAWIMENVTVRNCYIHDVGGEGLYVGHGFYNGRKESACDETTYSHSIQHIRLHDNLIENVGYDGIQIKNADLDCEVYNNVIRNYGTLDKGAHNEGLFIGGGTTGKFYNNYVINGTGHGIQFQGMGNVDIINNVIVDSFDNGFYGANGDQVYRIPDGYFNIINNTIINSGKKGFQFNNSEGGPKRLINNIIAGSGEELYKKGATLDTINNIMTQDIAYLNFTDVTNHDYSITANSAAINYGIDATDYGVIKDFLGNSRSVGAFDVGAYEYQQTLDTKAIVLLNNFEVSFSKENQEVKISDLKNKENKVLIYDFKGKLIDQKTTYASSINISTETWSSGVYLLVINDQSYRFLKE